MQRFVQNLHIKRQRRFHDNAWTYSKCVLSVVMNCVVLAEKAFKKQGINAERKPAGGALYPEGTQKVTYRLV